MKTLITGSNGYIGFKIALDMLQREQEVIGVDLNSGNGAFLYENSKFHFHKTDITNVATFSPKMKEADIFIHCAALVHKKSSDLSRENYFRVNYEGRNCAVRQFFRRPSSYHP